MTPGQDQTPLVDEQLSAWLDDELPAEELTLLLARLDRSPELRARAASYGLIGTCLRDGPSSATATQLLALSLSERVRAAIGEPDVARPEPVRRRLRVLRYAVATGLALVGVALVPVLKPPSVPGAVSAVTIVGQPPALAPPVQRLAVGGNGFDGRSAISPRRLTNYLVYHGEYSGMLFAKVADSHIVNQPAYAVAGLAMEGNSSP
ncbi:MAG: sigma-E factor negative regulatory protein [Gammaproteobacteria bacterium]